MKFKAILTDQLCMKDFFNIVTSFARLSKRAIIRISETGLHIGNKDIGINTNLVAWSEIGKDNFFAHFQMKGVDEEFNEIWLRICPEQLANVLITIKSHFIKVIVMKLTKKQFPCLSIDIEMAPPNSNNFRKLVHDVPVVIVPVREWPEYNQPMLHDYDISIHMPSLRSLRMLCEKMKNLAATMTICCISSGDLTFIAETDSAIVVSRYFNLTLEKLQHKPNEKADEPLEINCQIDTKQLSLCFASIQLTNCVMFGNILKNELFNIKIVVRDNVLLFFNIHCVDV